MLLPIKTAVTRAAASQSRTILAAFIIIISYLGGLASGKNCDYFREYFRERSAITVEIVPK